jgi:hypothetical protein
MTRYLICILLLFLFSCRNGIKFKKITKDPSINRYDFDYSDKINSSKLFCENFINAYRKIIDSNVNPKFKDSFPYQKEVAVNLYISNYKEIFFEIIDTTKQFFLVKATDYPIQVAMAWGLDIFGSTYSEPTNEDRAKFEQIPAITVVKGISFEEFNDNVGIYSIATYFQGDTSILSFSNYHFLGGSDSNRRLIYTTKGIGFLTPCRDLYPFEEAAKIYGNRKATSKIQEYFFKSQYFREVKTIDKVLQFATIMVEKYERSKINKDYLYTLIDFKHDRFFLQKMVDSNNVRKDLTDDILKDVEDRYVGGTLIFPYQGYKSFSYQWAWINVLLIALILFLKWLIQKKVKLALLISNIVSSTILVTINGWVYSRKPDNLPFYYWILPGLFFVLAIILFSKLKLPENKKT